MSRWIAKALVGATVGLTVVALLIFAVKFRVVLEGCPRERTPSARPSRAIQPP